MWNSLEKRGQRGGTEKRGKKGKKLSSRVFAGKNDSRIRCRVYNYNRLGRSGKRRKKRGKRGLELSFEGKKKVAYWASLTQY